MDIKTKYSDAIECLRQTLKEGRKTSDVDIRGMLANVHRCESLVEDILQQEQEVQYSNALSSVASSLHGNASVLNRKMRQLNSAMNRPTLPTPPAPAPRVGCLPPPIITTTANSATFAVDDDPNYYYPSHNPSPIGTATAAYAGGDEHIQQQQHQQEGFSVPGNMTPNYPASTAAAATQMDESGSPGVWAPRRGSSVGGSRCSTPSSSRSTSSFTSVCEDLPIAAAATSTPRNDSSSLTTPQAAEATTTEQKSPAGPERKSVIESTISRPSDISFSDVIGLELAKQALREAVITPLMFPHLFSGGRQTWRRILLYGPPGTGKSRLAQAVCAEVKATFYSVSSTDLMSSWVGETEKHIKELFQHAREQPGQSVIFIDEIDSLCRQRNSREDEGTRRIKTELLIQMEGRERVGQEKIFLLCATNCPWDLDGAFLRRFHKRIYIPLPDHKSRVQILQLHSSSSSSQVPNSSRVSVSDADWQELASLTEGYSGSDLTTLVMAALMAPVSELTSQQPGYWGLNDEKYWTPCDKDMPNAILTTAHELPATKILPREVRMSDFLQALSGHRPTVSEGELSRLEQFTTNFGQSA